MATATVNKPMTLIGVIYDVEFIGSNTWRVRIVHKDHVPGVRIVGDFLIEDTTIAIRFQNNIDAACIVTVDTFGYMDTFQYI